MEDCKATELGDERFTSVYHDIYFDDVSVNDVIDEMESKGHEYIDRGTDRIVFSGTDDSIDGGKECVVKIAVNWGGQQQNEGEYHNQDRFDYLLGVGDHDTGWVTMSRVEHIDNQEFLDFYDSVRREHDEIPSDFHERNCGITDDGDYVCFDYGRGFQQEEETFF